RFFFFDLCNHKLILNTEQNHGKYKKVVCLLLELCQYTTRCRVIPTSAAEGKCIYLNPMHKISLSAFTLCLQIRNDSALVLTSNDTNTFLSVYRIRRRYARYGSSREEREGDWGICF
ncbi:hypothetical protein SARC_04532, partial [Sphaeroforma arctica JP610]